MKKAIFMALAVAVTMVACKKDDNNSNPSNTISTTKKIKVKYGSTQQFGLFKLSDSSTHYGSADSATTNWDFGFIHTNYIPNIFFNSHFRGSGNAGIVLQSTLFDNVTSAPTSGYAYDTSATQFAVPYSSWYTYNPQTRLPQLLTPRTFVIKTADGNHYAKLEILAVGYDTLIPAGGAMMPDSLKYTFRYTYQANGSITF